MDGIYMWGVWAMAWLFGPDDNFVNKSVNRVNNSAGRELLRIQTRMQVRPRHAGANWMPKA